MDMLHMLAIRHMKGRLVFNTHTKGEINCILSEEICGSHGRLFVRHVKSRRSSVG